MNIPATISTVFIIIGCFLPWIQLGALINNKGINNPDAMIILGASIVGLIVSIATKRKWALLNLLVGLVCGFVGVVDYKDVAERVESSHSQGSIFSLSISVGTGLYLVLAGSALLIITSIIDVITGDKEKKLQVLTYDVEMASSMNNQENEEENGLKKASPLHTTTADELKKYKELLDTGAITEAEYNSIKGKLLG
jgi:hypothetical protein